MFESLAHDAIAIVVGICLSYVNAVDSDCYHDPHRIVDFVDHRVDKIAVVDDERIVDVDIVVLDVAIVDDNIQAIDFARNQMCCRLLKMSYFVASRMIWSMKATFGCSIAVVVAVAMPLVLHNCYYDDDSMWL